MQKLIYKTRHEGKRARHCCDGLANRSSVLFN